MLLTTHDLNSVAAHLPWVICLNKRIVAAGHPRRRLHRRRSSSRTYGAEMVVVRQGDLILVVGPPARQRPRTPGRTPSDARMNVGA